MLAVPVDDEQLAPRRHREHPDHGVVGGGLLRRGEVDELEVRARRREHGADGRAVLVAQDVVRDLVLAIAVLSRLRHPAEIDAAAEPRLLEDRALGWSWPLLIEAGPHVGADLAPLLPENLGGPLRRPERFARLAAEDVVLVLGDRAEQQLFPRLAPPPLSFLA